MKVGCIGINLNPKRTLNQIRLIMFDWIRALLL